MQTWRGFQLIFLGASWHGDFQAGLSLLREVYERGVPHSLLAVCTQAELHNAIYRALCCEASAVVQLDEPNHILNLLCAAARIASKRGALAETLP